MTHLLDAARLKLNRGNEHLESLRQEIEAFRGRHPYAITGEFDSQTSEYVFRVRIFEDPPERLAVIGGDCIHNFRSALDQIAHRLVETNGNTPTDTTQFPIVDHPSRFPQASHQTVVGMKTEHLALIELMQPYHRGNPPYSPEIDYSIRFLGAHPLAFLRDLSNQDKHRELHTLVGIREASGPPVPVLEALTDVASFGDLGEVATALDDGAEIARVAITPSGPSPVMKMETDLTPFVTLANKRPYEQSIFYCGKVATGIFRTFVSVLGPSV